MNAVYAIVMGLLAVAAVLTLIRLLRGPGVLDRIVALDVLVTLLVVGIALALGTTLSPSAGVLLIVVTLLAFIGSVTAAHLVEEREDVR